VPVGWKMPSASTEPSSALYFCSAAGLAIENGVSVSPAMKDDEGCVNVMTAVVGSGASQLLYRLSFGAPLFGSYVAKPPKMVCQ
jgi:hypothetical protein